MNQYYTFKQLNNGEKVVMTSAAVTWSDLADKFYDFLLGCGFILSKGDLALYFTKYIEEERYESEENEFPDHEPRPIENHAERYGQQPPEEWHCDDKDCAGDCVDKTTQPSIDEEVAAMQFDNPSTKLYEFTVTDTHGRVISDIWTTAKDCVIIQREFEANNDEPTWPPHRLVMTECKWVAPANGIQYTFEVQCV